MKYVKAIDFIQYIWKKVFNTEKSRSQVRRELEQGSVKLNDRKINVDDVFEIDSNESGIICRHCGEFNTHEECGTYQVLNPTCKKCGNSTEG
jgi:hypothetical protein